MKKKAAIYARFSSDMQREESIDAQVRACREYAEREGYEVVKIYSDEAMTAKNDRREDFQNMIYAAMSTNDFDYILVHKFNRFARNKFDSVIYKKKLRDIGKNVISVTQKIDDSPEGKMLEGVIEAVDEYYSANLALEVIKGMRENALKGVSTGGRPPLGYSYGPDGRLLPNDKAFIVQRIFSMYLEGYGKLMIANKLNAEGFRSQTGNEFAARTISDILNNEKYTGTNIYTIGNEVIKVEGTHKAIIDRDTWLAAQAARGKRHKPRMNGDVVYALTGKMFCGACGERYSGGGHKKASRGTGRVNYYYVCTAMKYKKCDNRSVNKEKIEHYISKHILTDLLTDKRMEQIAAEFDRIAAETEERRKKDIDIDVLRKERSELEKQREKLMDLYMLGKFKIEELDKRHDLLTKQIANIDSRISAASYTGDIGIKKEDALKRLTYFKESFDLSDKSFVKSLLDTFIDKIIVHRDRVEIRYKIDFDGPDNDNNGGKVIKTGIEPHSASVGSTDGRARPLPLLPPLIIKHTVSLKEIKRVKVD